MKYKGWFKNGPDFYTSIKEVFHIKVFFFHWSVLKHVLYKKECKFRSCTHHN